MEPLNGHNIEDETTDDKYVVMKKENFWLLLGYLNDGRRSDIEMIEEAGIAMVHDAVVIRRQDYIAAPALSAYSNLIGLAAIAMGPSDPELGARLLRVADYFDRQSGMGYKWPGD
jgi:hypothetical protein